MMKSLFVVTLFLLLANATHGLKILLTNEAGIEEHGLRTLRAALVRKGHHVSTFAPKSDQTGMGAALNMPTVQVEPYGDLADDMWAVDGYPSTAVLVGLAQMDREPDLVRITYYYIFW